MIPREQPSPQPFGTRALAFWCISRKNKRYKSLALDRPQHPLPVAHPILGKDRWCPQAMGGFASFPGGGEKSSWLPFQEAGQTVD